MQKRIRLGLPLALALLSGCTEINNLPNLNWLRQAMTRFGLASVPTDSGVALFMKTLIFILIFTILYFATSKLLSGKGELGEKQTNRIVVVISLIIALMGTLLIPNDFIVQLYQQYSVIVALILAMAPVIAGVAIYFEVIEKSVKEGKMSEKTKHVLGFIIWLVLFQVYGALANYYFYLPLQGGRGSYATIAQWAGLTISVMGLLTLLFFILILLDVFGNKKSTSSTSEPSAPGPVPETEPSRPTPTPAPGARAPPEVSSTERPAPSEEPSTPKISVKAKLDKPIDGYRKALLYILTLDKNILEGSERQAGVEALMRELHTLLGNVIENKDSPNARNHVQSAIGEVKAAQRHHKHLYDDVFLPKQERYSKNLEQEKRSLDQLFDQAKIRKGPLSNRRALDKNHTQFTTLHQHIRDTLTKSYQEFLHGRSERTLSSCRTHLEHLQNALEQGRQDQADVTALIEIRNWLHLFIEEKGGTVNIWKDSLSAMDATRIQIDQTLTKILAKA